MRNYTLLSVVIGLALAVAGLFVPLLAVAGFAAEPAAPYTGAPGEPAATVTYTVNVTGDTVLTSGCVSGPNPCTLRGAIQLANASGANNKIIVFAAGLNPQYVSLGSTLTITGGGISIIGSGREVTSVHGPGSEPAFQIASSNNTIADLKVLGFGEGHPNEDGVRLVSGSGNSINRLTLSNMGGKGIFILSGSSDNQVTGSYVGTHSYGGGVIDTSCSLGNIGVGIMVDSGDNVIGGNIIGCNHEDGVYLVGPNATNNLLVLNEIGVAPNGHSIANSGHGVNIDSGASNNKIGVNSALGTNVIAGNLANGVHIGGGGTSGNTVRNNLIGLSPTGTFAVGNIFSGIQIDDSAHDNIIGGRVLTEANTIGGNGGNGITIDGIGAGNAGDTNFNGVYGNRIGLNAAGTLTVPNLSGGVFIDNGAMFNVVGADDDAYRNTIRGNARQGIGVQHANHNTVAGNTLSANGLFGIVLDDAASNTVSANDSSGHAAAGILVSGTAATTNTLKGNSAWNSIAYGIALSQGAHANVLDAQSVYGNAAGIVLLGAGTSGNLITHTHVYSNLVVGIGEGLGASNNAWSHLSVHDTFVALGIDKDPIYTVTAPFPVVVSVTVNGGKVTVYGKASLAILQSVRVELYRAATNRSGYGEGKTFLGEDMADGNGDWSITYTGASGCFTAFETVKGFLQVYPSSSEFGPNSCRVMLPVVAR